MKKIPILITITMLGLLASCWQDNWFSMYSFTNESGFPIKIITYSTKSNVVEISDTLVIENDSTYTEIVKHGEDHGWTGNSKILFNPDSLYMIFGDKKLLVYYPCDSSWCDEAVKNILNEFTYDEQCSRKVGCDYIYTITVDDYENAKEIIN